MTPIMLILLSTGLILNSALYLGFVAWLGVVWGLPFATVFAVAAMGFSYVGYSLQLANTKRIASMCVVLLSVLFGVAGGLIILVHWLR